ncbi:hypothetical protein TNCV_1852131 [Trichonephila clavipes]|nr:hypothetical protein TNCV_1852131 [Trichonephila clavipes]
MPVVTSLRDGEKVTSERCFGLGSATTVCLEVNRHKSAPTVRQLTGPVSLRRLMTMRMTEEWLQENNSGVVDKVSRCADERLLPVHSRRTRERDC